ALLLVTAGFVAYEFFTFREGMTHELSALAEIIGSRSSAALTFDDKLDAGETLGALGAKRHIRAAALYDKDGKIFAQFPPGNTNSNLFPSQTEANGAHFRANEITFYQDIIVKG